MILVMNSALIEHGSRTMIHDLKVSRSLQNSKYQRIMSWVRKSPTYQAEHVLFIGKNEYQLPVADGWKTSRHMKQGHELLSGRQLMVPSGDIAGESGRTWAQMKQVRSLSPHVIGTHSAVVLWQPLKFNTVPITIAAQSWHHYKRAHVLFVSSNTYACVDSETCEQESCMKCRRLSLLRWGYTVNSLWPYRCHFSSAHHNIHSCSTLTTASENASKDMFYMQARMHGIHQAAI